MPRSHFRAALTYVFGSASKREKRMKGVLFIGAKIFVGAPQAPEAKLSIRCKGRKKIECDCLSENLVEESTSRSK